MACACMHAKNKGGIAMTGKTAEATTEKEAAGYYFALFNSNTIPMFTWKYDGTFTSANDAFLTLLGYTRSDFEEGRLNWKKITPEGYEQADHRCTEELKHSGHAKVLDKEYYNKKGSKIRVHIYNFVLNKHDDHGFGIIISPAHK